WPVTPHPSESASRLASPQLPPLLRRAADLVDGDVDAVRCAIMAGLPADGLGGAPGLGRVCRADSGVPARVDRRSGRRCERTAPDSRRNADGLDAARLRA